MSISGFPYQQTIKKNFCNSKQTARVSTSANKITMSGHNKWSKIKHKKAVTDAKKSKEFSKFAKLIAFESKEAGGDPNSPSLREAIEKAKQANMPRENIERAILRGKGSLDEVVEVVIYETYGPAGVAILIEGLTNNRNRTAAEIKHILSKHNTVLAEPGAALWAFEKSSGSWKAKAQTALSTEEREKLVSLINVLLDHDDVQEVFTNAEEV